MNPWMYTKSHEWICLEGTLAKVGVTPFLLRAFGPVVRVQLPQKGSICVQGEVLATYETANNTYPIYAPLTGTVVQVNNALQDNPALLNAHPMDAGWLVGIAVAEPVELQSLCDEKEYYRYALEWE